MIILPPLKPIIPIQLSKHKQVVQVVQTIDPPLIIRTTMELMKMQMLILFQTQILLLMKGVHFLVNSMIMDIKCK